MLIQASSGGGKSHTLRKLLEEVREIPQLVFDIEGEFVTLANSFPYQVVNAESDGFDVLEFLKGSQSVIYNLADVGHETRPEMVGLVVHELMEAPPEFWRPLIVVVDEAHLFAPQSGKSVSKGPLINLATRGRKRGFCVVMATQRISKLHKDSAAELQNKLIGKTVLDVDVARSLDDLGFSKQDANKLKGLDPGQFWASGPAICPAPKKIKVLDTQTKPPVDVYAQLDKKIEVHAVQTGRFSCSVPNKSNEPKQAATNGSISTIADDVQEREKRFIQSAEMDEEARRIVEGMESLARLKKKFRGMRRKIRYALRFSTPSKKPFTAGVVHYAHMKKAGAGVDRKFYRIAGYVLGKVFFWAAYLIICFILGGLVLCAGLVTFGFSWAIMGRLPGLLSSFSWSKGR